MVSVSLRLGMSGILDEYPNLAAYVARGEARPAYRRAFAAHLGHRPGRGAREAAADGRFAAETRGRIY